MPFLYLPDAVSVTLLLLVLVLLRRSAGAHFRQELNRLRMDVIECRKATGHQAAIPACVNLGIRIKSAIECAEGVSPARLFFVARLLREYPRTDWGVFLPDWYSGFDFLIRSVEDRQAREKLVRIQMELHTNLGVYYLFASVSGWILATGTLCRLIRRSFSRSSPGRIDWLFDVLERLFIRQGRRAHRLALICGRV